MECLLVHWGQRTPQPLVLSRGQGRPEVEGREGRDQQLDGSGNAREEEDPVLKTMTIINTALKEEDLILSEECS